MAEKSTRIAEAISGEYIATRDAYENDDGAHARTIQIVDTASRQIDTWTDMRGTSVTKISSNDSVDLESFSETTLTVGDKTTVVVSTVHSENNGSVTITPICYTSSGVFVPLESKTTAVGAVVFNNFP